MMKIIKVMLVGLVMINTEIYAAEKSTVCFTPQQNCTAKIVSLIDHAKTSIYVQAYSFTSHPIIQALLQAQARGVKVAVILDKSEFTGEHYSPARLLARHGIPIWNDNTLDIAHNKVMIIDRSIVETGSFNYTTSAQFYNAENVLIMYDPALAKQYLANWYHRQHASVYYNFITH